MSHQLLLSRMAIEKAARERKIEEALAMERRSLEHQREQAVIAEAERRKRAPR